MQQVTIYTRGMISMTKIEAKLIHHGTRKYAQYDHAVEVEFIQKRKRSPHSMIKGSHVDFLIVEGWNNPDPASMFDESTRESLGGGVESVRGRYSSCDPRIQSDFDAMIDAKIADGSVKVVADYRGWNSYRGIKE